MLINLANENEPEDAISEETKSQETSAATSGAQWLQHADITSQRVWWVRSARLNSYEREMAP
jgi:hypothetical protein